MKHLKTYKLFESDFNFNFGDCEIYAIALHRLYGYPLYVVNGYYKEPDWDEEMGWTAYLDEPCHVVVKLPNGKYLDANGETSEEKLKKDCLFSNEVEYIKIEPISEEEAKYLYTGEDKEDYIEEVINMIKSNESYQDDSLNPSSDEISNLNLINVKLKFNVRKNLYESKMEIDYNDNIDYIEDLLLELKDSGFKIYIEQFKIGSGGGYGDDANNKDGLKIVITSESSNFKLLPIDIDEYLMTIDSYLKENGWIGLHNRREAIVNVALRTTPKYIMQNVPFRLSEFSKYLKSNWSYNSPFTSVSIEYYKP